MDKLDFKKEFREYYSPKKDAPQMLNLPKFQYAMIDGSGDPNTSEQFRKAIEALYGVSYGIKFARKFSGKGPDLTLGPLEGLWWADDMDVFSAKCDKSKWEWTLMIMVPSFVAKDEFTATYERLHQKKPDLPQVRLQNFTEGQAVQILHIGPYSEERPTVEKLHDYALSNGLKLAGKHHEIYLGDPRRGNTEKLRTIIRQPVMAPGKS